MTANQYREAIGALGLTQGEAAEFLHISIRTSWGYANGEMIPDLVADYLKLLLDNPKLMEKAK